MNNSHVCVIIPMYNEERSIASVIRDVRAYVSDIIVIDDGSLDDSFARACATGVQVYRQPRNIGKGAALQRGFDIALEQHFDIIITLDADGQHRASDIPKLIKASDEAAFVIGVRPRVKDDLFGKAHLTDRDPG